VRRGWLAAIGVVAGCGGAAANHEELGDRAYAARHFPDAVVEYRLALKQKPSAALRAKAAAAALRAGDLVTAADEYRALAREGGPERATEAADGLERVAKAAVAADDRAALQAALLGLRALGQGRALGTFAWQLVQSLGAEPRSQEALNVLASAAAAAPDARHQDSLMFVYGSGLMRLGRCEAAMQVFEALVRRQREPAVVPASLQGRARCALQLGRQALEEGQAERAEEWFREAAAGADERDPVARAAYLGLGDVLFARGALAEAAEAYQRVLSGAAPGDSLAQIAAEKLNVVANAGTVIR
jgi:tetratricopeptide (TPR) repeat protein